MLEIWTDGAIEPEQALSDAAKLLSKPELLTTTVFDVSSEYFEVRGRMRIDQTIVEERSLVLKQRGKVRTMWRERGGFLRSESGDAMGKS